MNATPTSTMLRCQTAFTACASILLAITLITTFGCGSAEEEAAEATAQASGTVTVNGKAVTRGTVALYSLQSGASAEATLDRGGKFKLTDPLAPGQYTVFLSRTAGVPEKFLSETSSDYTVTLKEGANELVIDLK
jgi:hypothetical protein